MALIKCPECGIEISDKASVCIHCGYPLHQEEVVEETLINVNVDEIIQFLYDRVNYFMSNLEEYNKKTALFIFENKSKIEELIAEAKKLEKKGDYSLWDKIAIAIVRIDKQMAYYSGWEEHKKFFEYIEFDKIQTDGQKEIVNELLKSFEEKLFGKTNHITYWYPIYEILLYGTEENKNILNNYLSGLNNTGSQTRYDDVIMMVNENLGSPSLIPTKNQSVANYAISQNITTNVPKCPTCQSTNIKKVSGISKIGSVAMWGIFSQKVKKQWHCNNCGSEW